jgi:cation diffusion facilitator family transporter
MPDPVSSKSATTKTAPSLSKEGMRITVIGMFINIFLTVAKILIGFFGRSTALIADGIHSLSDLLSDFVVIFSIRLSALPEDESHNYGHDKIETLASAVVGIMLLFAGAYICYDGGRAIYDFIQGVPIEQPMLITFFAALASIIIKELLYQDTQRVAKQLDSDMLKANAWHHRSDGLTSIGVAAGIGAAIVLGEKWAVLDPIIAVLLAIYIIYVGLKILYKSLNDLMEASLSPQTNKEIESIIITCDNVLNCHSLKTRKIGSRKAIEAHIMVDGEITIKEAALIQKSVEKRLKDKYGLHTHVIIKVEPFLPNKVVREKHIIEGL